MKVLYISLLLILTGCASEPSKVLKDYDSVEMEIKRSAGAAMGGSQEIGVYQPPAPPAASPAPAPAAPAPAAPPIAAVEVTGISASYSRDIILVKSVIPSAQSLTEDTKSFILLPKKATSQAGKDKHQQICSEWAYTFFVQKETSNIPITVKRVPFYWFVKDKQKEKDINKIKCETLIENYDHARAYALARSLKLNVTKSYIVLTHLKLIITLDLTNISKDDDISTAMDIWKQKMIMLPIDSGQLGITSIFYSTRVVLGSLGVFLALK